MRTFSNSIRLKKPKRSTFDLSHDHKLSCKMGYLVPMLTMEVLPGEEFRMSSEAMYRMMPMVAPIMHKVDAYMHYFFVPNRILWDGWDKFISPNNPGNEPYPLFPVMNTGPGGMASLQESELGDYLGLPTGVPLAGTNLSALPFAAYYKIWHEYYRDQNMYAEEDVKLIDGIQTVDVTQQLIKLRRRAWEHDYFTAALPFAQKGEPVILPMTFADDPVDVTIRQLPGTPPQFVDQSGIPGATGPLELEPSYIVDSADEPMFYDPRGNLVVNPEAFEATTTINDLRTAFSLQKWLEKNARGGTRLIETIYVHFGVKPADARLQRPEYLGGSRSSIAISEVLQTSSTDDESPQGNMAGHGISVNAGRDFRYYTPEWGYIIGILSIRPKTSYFQGVPRHWLKTKDFLQYYWSEFAHLGEQEIYNQELYLTDDQEYNNETFGYIPRYSEYRYMASRVSGEMRKSLDHWHMARRFEDRPALNREFIDCVPTKRIFAVTDPDQDEIIAHIYHRIRARRPLPLYGTPGGL